MSYARYRCLTTPLAIVLIASWAPAAWAQQGPGGVSAATQEAAPAGDPYTLNVDPVTGDPLPEVKRQVVIDHGGRELRFGSGDSVQAFQKDPGGYLPSVDQRVVAQQLPYYPLKTCVVSGKELGGEMGDPIDAVYRNRLVRLCCPMCEEAFTQDPAVYLGKLDQAVKDRQAAGYPLKTCPVSGMELGGAMGDPVEVVVANRLVRLCGEACIGKLRTDPVKYLAALDAARAGGGT
jgi:YHS domain-containing protein